MRLKVPAITDASTGNMSNDQYTQLLYNQAIHVFLLLLCVIKVHHGLPAVYHVYM